MAKLDPDKSGYIETGEFLDAMIAYITHKMEGGDDEGAPAAAADGGGDDDDDGDEEDAEVPEDLAEMGWEEQQSAIKKRSLKLMGAGLLLVLVFSDPMVDVMNNMGARVGVPPFYVAFILAPLASNASEFIASYNYAAKKTKKTITVALAALEGAACMNNTFCLAIFMGLIFFQARQTYLSHERVSASSASRDNLPAISQNLAWKFTAETVAIVTIELIMAAFAVQRVTPSRARQISAAPRRACRGCTSRPELTVVSRPHIAALRRARFTQPRWACACSLSSQSPSSPSPSSKARASTNLSGSRRPRRISPAARSAHRAPATPLPLPPGSADPLRRPSRPPHLAHYLCACVARRPHNCSVF